MRRILRLPLCLFAPLWLLSRLAAEVPVSPESDIFGDDNVRTVRLDQAAAAFANNRVDPDNAEHTAYRHTVVFQNGRQLRGEIISVDANEIIFRHPDSTAPLHIARSEVRRLVLTNTSSPEGTQIAPRILSLEDSTVGGQPVRCTVKLPGAEWLYGDVSSRDGETFEVRLNPKVSLTIPRADIEWLQFDRQPAPAYGFFGNPLDLDGWAGPRRSAPWEVHDGTLEVDSGKWLARQLSTPSRFEVSMEIPRAYERGTRLWLQPFELVNSYTTGTVQFEFSRSAITRLLFRNGFEQRRSLLPLTAKSTEPTVKYRLLYDRYAQHLVILRNGQKAGDWKFGDVGNSPGINSFDRQIRGISLDRNGGDEPGELHLKRLEVRPWNGAIPSRDDRPPLKDLFSTSVDEPAAGHLDSLSDRVASFDGTRRQIEAGTFIEFPHQPAALTNQDSSLVFGESGELRTGDLLIGNGVAHFRTSFSRNAEMPLESLQTISLHGPSSDPLPADLLVFKNGDELPGTLRSAAPGQPVRWQLNGGQIAEFKPERVAGVHFAVGDDPAETAVSETVELRNGDRLRGEVKGFDNNQLRMAIPGLGEIAVDRGQLWALYPNLALTVADATQNPEAWMDRAAKWLREATGDKCPAEPSNSWIYFDGTYLPRTGPSLTDRSDALILEQPSLNMMERFEVRCNVTNTRGGAPMFTIGLNGFIGTPILQASCFFGQLHVMAMGGANVRRANSFQIPLADKLRNASSRVNVRVFVDAKAGTADFYLDGVPVAQLGHHNDDRLPKIGARISFQPYPGSNDPMVFSDLWIGPWNGEVPAPGAQKSAVTLNNGDLMEGTVKAIGSDKITVDSEIGAMDLPTERVGLVQFGGAMKVTPADARIRLRNGTAIQVDRFAWDGEELVAHSEALGDIRLPHAEVSELIPAPPATRLPADITAKPMIKKENPNQQARQPDVLTQ